MLYMKVSVYRYIQNDDDNSDDALFIEGKKPIDNTIEHMHETCYGHG